MVVQGLAGGLRPPDPRQGGSGRLDPPLVRSIGSNCWNNFIFFCETKSARVFGSKSSKEHQVMQAPQENNMSKLLFCGYAFNSEGSRKNAFV